MPCCFPKHLPILIFLCHIHKSAPCILCILVTRCMDYTIWCFKIALPEGTVVPLTESGANICNNTKLFMISGCHLTSYLFSIELSLFQNEQIIDSVIFTGQNKTKNDWTTTTLDSLMITKKRQCSKPGSKLVVTNFWDLRCYKSSSENSEKAFYSVNAVLF